MHHLLSSFEVEVKLSLSRCEYAWCGALQFCVTGEWVPMFRCHASSSMHCNLCSPRVSLICKRSFTCCHFAIYLSCDRTEICILLKCFFPSAPFYLCVFCYKCTRLVAIPNTMFLEIPNSKSVLMSRKKWSKTLFTHPIPMLTTLKMAMTHKNLPLATTITDMEMNIAHTSPSKKSTPSFLVMN